MLLHPTAFAFLLLVPGSLAAQEWPQWRGPNRDGISAETGLLKEWPAAGPALVWKAKGLGIGYSGVSVVGKIIFTQADKGSKSYVIALHRENGLPLWETELGKGGAP